MKKTLFSIIFLFLPLMICAQDEAHIQREIDELHKPTKFVNDSVAKLMKECEAQIKICNDSVLIKKLNTRLDDLWNIYDSNLRTQVQNDLDFARRNPNSLLALKLIRTRLPRQEGMEFYETYESVFQNFSDEVKASEEAKEMAEKLSYFKQSKIGSIAPEFTVKDSNGKQLSLSDFKGKKYILLEFWASFCGPCREEFSYMKELYGKYNQMGFEIISITKDQDLDKWKNAIAKDKIAIWSQVSTLENDDSVEKKYFVSGIPHKVLIDKNGVIIGKWKGGGEKNKNELQQILAEIFGEK